MSTIKKDNVGSMSNDEGYRSVITSLVKLDDVKGAQDIFNEWEPERYEFADFSLLRGGEV